MEFRKEKTICIKKRKKQKKKRKSIKWMRRRIGHVVVGR
jgi:hypothetical protein